MDSVLDTMLALCLASSLLILSGCNKQQMTMPDNSRGVPVVSAGPDTGSPKESGNGGLNKPPRGLEKPTTPPKEVLAKIEVKDNVSTDIRYPEGANSAWMLSAIRVNSKGDTTSYRGMAVAFHKSANGQCLLMTAKHVIKGTEIVLGAPYRSEVTKEDYQRVTVLSQDPKLDLAIVAINDAEGCNPRAIAQRDSDIGTLVNAFGQPLQHQGLYSTGVISAYWTKNGTPTMFNQLPVFEGFSGGGLLDASYQIVGLVTSVPKNDDRFSYALPGSVLRDYIVRTRLLSPQSEYEKETDVESPAPTEPSSTEMMPTANEEAVLSP